MSLILEALQRADKERKDVDQVPGIDANHSVRYQPQGHRAVDTSQQKQANTLLYPLLAAVAVLLLYLIYLQIKESRAGVAAAKASMSNEISVASAPAASVATPGQGVGAIRGTVQPARVIENIQPREPVARARVSRPQPAMSSVTPTEPLNFNYLYEQAARERQAEARRAKEEQVVAAEQAAQAAFSADIPEVFEAEPDPYDMIPFAQQLTSEQRSSVPPLRYTTHGFNPVSGKGAVTLNGTMYRRGDTVAPGLTLLDIRADYIVLEKNGLVFRLEATTNWNG